MLVSRAHGATCGQTFGYRQCCREFRRPRGCWQGVLVDPGAERAFDEGGDPGDVPSVRYALTVGGGDLVGWMPLPQ